MSAPGCRMSPDGRSVHLDWSEGVAQVVPSIWLADNDPAARHPHTNQRLRTVLALPADPILVSATARPEGLGLVWADPLPAATIPWARIRARIQASEDHPTQPWSTPPNLDGLCFDWTQIQSEPAQEMALVRTLQSRGLVIIEGVPTTPGMVATVAERWNGVRETNYGRVFDVLTKPDAEHLAYTGVALALHTDNPYRRPVPSLQLLHCLSADATGGESLFADGFAAAQDLRQQAPWAAQVLAQTCVPFRYRDADCDIRAQRPLIDRWPDGRLRAICHNDRSMAPLDLPNDALLHFYAAYRTWSALLEEPERVLRTTLRPGQLVVFDNTRVLHGRTALSVHAGGSRHLQGCYTEWDGVKSRLQVLGRLP